MSNSKTSPTLVITGLKLNKDDDGSNVDPMLFKRIVGSLMYLTAARPIEVADRFFPMSSYIKQIY